MTAHRRPEIRWSDAEQGICRWCGEDIHFESGEKKGTINRRRRWHPACVDIYNASDPREARRRIRKRDRGHCAVCRVDTYKVRRELRKIGRGRTRAIRERGYKPGKSFWELDHIVPLIDGGSHHDENLQSLCTPCHTQKTAEEARARATRNSVVDSEPESPPVTTSRAKSKTPSLEQLLEAADAVNARVAKVLAKA
jgi:5-methylcytosine-specific restriction endonuclease McrA